MNRAPLYWKYGEPVIRAHRRARATALALLVLAALAVGLAVLCWPDVLAAIQEALQ